MPGSSPGMTKRPGLRHRQRDQAQAQASDRGQAEERDAVAEMVADIARQYIAQRGANAGRGADHALGEIEMPAAESDVGDDQRRQYAEHRSGDTVEELHGDE